MNHLFNLNGGLTREERQKHTGKEQAKFRMSETKTVTHWSREYAGVSQKNTTHTHTHTDICPPSATEGQMDSV